MAFRSLTKVFLAFAMVFGAWSLGSGTAAAADQCTVVKAKAECNKKAGCAWNGKACAGKVAGKSAAKPAGKGAKTAAGKPAKPAPAAKKPEAAPKKPEVKPEPTTPAEPPLDEEIPAGDGEAEDF
jgi:hypothetical protein